MTLFPFAFGWCQVVSQWHKVRCQGPKKICLASLVLNQVQAKRVCRHATIGCILVSGASLLTGTEVDGTQVGTSLRVAVKIILTLTQKDIDLLIIEA
jgi:hypothetical protein